MQDLKPGVDNGAKSWFAILHAEVKVKEMTHNDTYKSLNCNSTTTSESRMGQADAGEMK